MTARKHKKITSITHTTGSFNGKAITSFVPDYSEAYVHPSEDVIIIRAVQLYSPSTISEIFLQMDKNIQNGEHEFPGSPGIHYLDIYPLIGGGPYEVTQAKLSVNFDLTKGHFKGSITLDGYLHGNTTNTINLTCAYDLKSGLR